MATSPEMTPPAEPVPAVAGSETALYPRFSEAEFARRHAAAQALIAHHGIDVLVVYGNSSLYRHNQADIHYLTGFLGNRNNYVVFPARATPVLFAQSFNHVPNAREISAIETRWGGIHSAQTVSHYIRDVHPAVGTLGYVGEVPVQSYLTWQRDLAGWRFVDVTGAFRELRLHKSAEELDWLRKGARLTDLAIEHLIETVKPGMREYQLGGLIEEAALAQGGLPHLYYISSTSQDASIACVPRQNLSSRRIARGDVINTEISISFWGYSGQLHRPIFIQQEPGRRYRALWDTAFEAYTRCSEVLRSGATTEDVLNAAECIHERGFTINDGLLHGFGIGLLDPSVRTRRTVQEPHTPFRFEAGMTVVVQPNVVTLDERAGVQVGNLLHITDSGTECLHRVPVQYFVTS